MCERTTVSRRSVLTGMTAVAGAFALGRGAFGAMAGTPAKSDDFVASKSDRLVPFAMSQVRLLDGFLKQQAQINQEYLASLNTDRLLHSFRLTSGLTSTATPYGGWEKPDCQLRGHFTGGHYLGRGAGLRECGERDAAQER